ncbi:hypothetical protein ACFOEP_09120 [Microbacterium amylolyticum]|uniref:hypothetical protein n=1 Tax=Microbacterium amylolyticum TaxID=936337 RepID=UPI00360C3A30
MTRPVRLALRIWRDRGQRSPGDRAFAVYLAAMLTLTVVAPIARAAWLGIVSPDGIAMLTSDASAHVTSLIVATVWASSLILGRDRGPAVRPQFLTHALATSSIPRSVAFLGPVLRSGVGVVLLTTAASGAIGAGLVSAGSADLLAGVTFAVTGAVVGTITAVLWLMGQALPRAAVVTAAGIITLGSVSMAIPSTMALTPWGWAGLAYPGADVGGALIALTAVSIAFIACTPTLINRVRLSVLIDQASRWDQATGHATAMSLDAAVSVYRPLPRVGRTLRAIPRRAPLPLTFFVRDAVGASRTPGRLIAGTTALVLATLVVVLASAPEPRACSWVPSPASQCSPASVPSPMAYDMPQTLPPASRCTDSAMSHFSPTTSCSPRSRSPSWG